MTKLGDFFVFFESQLLTIFRFLLFYFSDGNIGVCEWHAPVTLAELLPRHLFVLAQTCQFVEMRAMESK